MGRDAAGFDLIATRIFAPIYPVIAERLLSWSKKREGICVDLGTGPGLLAIAVAGASSMTVAALDIDPQMLTFAAGHIRDAGLSGRVAPVLADVHHLPFYDDTVDLFVSRGSIFYWDDRARVFSEVHRALAPGGAAYLGGSFGTAALRQEIFERMRTKNPHWDRDVARRSARIPPETMLCDLEAAGIPHAGIKKEETGFWVEITKPGI